MSSLVVSLHPIVQHHIAALRDVRTPPAEFRRVVRMLAVLLAQEATADLPTIGREVTTPLGTRESAGLARRRRDRADSASGTGDGRWGHRALARGRGLAYRAVPRRIDAATEGVLQQVPGLTAGDAGLAGRPDARHGRFGGPRMRDHQGGRRPADEAALADRRTRGNRESCSERCRTCRFTSARSTNG